MMSDTRAGAQVTRQINRNDCWNKTLDAWRWASRFT